MDTTTTRNPNAPPDTPRVHCLSPSFGLRVRRGSFSLALEKQHKIHAVTFQQYRQEPSRSMENASAGICAGIYPERRRGDAYSCMPALRGATMAPGAGRGRVRWGRVRVAEGASPARTDGAGAECCRRDAGHATGSPLRPHDLGDAPSREDSLVTAGFAVMAAGPGGAWAGRFFVWPRDAGGGVEAGGRERGRRW